MLISGPIPKPKVLFVLDLDFTHFNSDAKEATWLGSKETWLCFYQHCIDYANEMGIELIFAVVTNKLSFDDIATEAAIEFEHLLSRANADMYIEGSNRKWCLIDYNSTLTYESLIDEKSTNCRFTNVISHFVIEHNLSKTPFILNIAKRHDILPEHCLLLDDTPSVLLDAKSKGIQTVSFEEFCPEKLLERQKLSDPNFVEPILTFKREQILTQFQNMLESVVALNQPPAQVVMAENVKPIERYDHDFVSDNFSRLMAQRDPKDCLYSWGSFRLVLGLKSEPEPELVEKALQDLRLK